MTGVVERIVCSRRYIVFDSETQVKLVTQFIDVSMKLEFYESTELFEPLLYCQVLRSLYVAPIFSGS